MVTVIGNNPQILWQRPLDGSDINELADLIQTQMLLIPVIQQESVANHAMIRALDAVGAQTVWTARTGHEHFPHQCETTYRSPSTLVKYDVCWSLAADQTSPSEILQTKIRIVNYHTRFYSMLGNWIDSAVDAVMREMDRAYVFAVYPTEGVDDGCWSRIVPENGTYELILEPDGANDDFLRVNDWINEGEGTITLNNQRVIREAFGRGGNHHLIGLWDRPGSMRLLSDVQNRECGTFSFALFSLRRVTFQSDTWNFNNWLP